MSTGPTPAAPRRSPSPHPENRRDAGPDDQEDGRDETESERLDRNWAEILQELRVIQTGTQILTGFLLAIAFQPRFADLDAFQVDVYLVLVGTAVVATALGLAPVSLHRELFRRRAKHEIVHVANILLRTTLVAVGLVLVGTVLLVFDVTTSRPLALGIAGGLLALLIALWVVLPRVVHRRSVD